MAGVSTDSKQVAGYRSAAEILLPALTFLLGLQVLRVLVPGLTWLLGDRWSVIVTAGGLGLLRLLLQFQWPDPLINLILAMAGTVLFVLFVPIYLDVARLRGGGAVAHFALGLLTGLALDTAIHGAFATYDIAWQQTLPPILVAVLLVLTQWLFLAASSSVRQSDSTEDSPRPGVRPLPWLAIGPFLFLQLVVFQNIPRMSALTGWQLPFCFTWILLAQLIALVVTACLLSVRWRNSWLLVTVTGAVLIAVTAVPYPQTPWLLLPTLLLGQVSLSTLMVIVIAGIGHPCLGFVPGH